MSSPVPFYRSHIVSQKIVAILTASFHANGPSVGNVVIQEFTNMHYIMMLDGRVETTEGTKAYSINPREPVNRDDSGFTLARTGERLVIL